MKLKHFITFSFILSILVSGCKQRQEARRPISHSSGTFMKKSVDRNKKLVASEEDQIKAVIKSTPTVEYFTSAKGYWYSYEIKNEQDTLTPKKGDIAFFDYEIKDIDGNIIYSQLELRPQVYRVDKQDIMSGLRDGIKLMHKKEKINFLFPSHMGYGYHGDNKKIGINQPLLCTVTLNDFKPESVYKTELNPVVDTDITKKEIKENIVKPKTVVKKTIVNQVNSKDTIK